MKKDNVKRAVQFIPFAALRGFDEMLAEELAIKEDRIELGEDDCARISETLLILKKNDFVRVRFYDKTRYRKECGTVAELDFMARYLKVGMVKIPFADLSDVTIE